VKEIKSKKWDFQNHFKEDLRLIKSLISFFMCVKSMLESFSKSLFLA
jgi:hypothetical protein